MRAAVMAILLATGACVVDWTRPGGSDNDGGRPGDAAPNDSGEDAPALADADSPPGPCFEVSTFPAPVRIDVLVSASNDDGPSLTTDLLHIFFRSNRGAPGSLGIGNIFHARRFGTDQEWELPTHVAELDGEGGIREPEVSGDGLTIYFGTNRQESREYEIWVSHRDHIDDRWDAPTIAPGLEGIPGTAPSVTADGLMMVFESEEMPPDFHDDLYLTERRDKSEPWGRPQWLEPVNTTGAERGPFVTRDGLVLYFERVEANGVTNIYRASRESRRVPFSEPARVDSLSSEQDDVSPFLSEDCSLFYMGRTNTSGDLEIVASF